MIHSCQSLLVWSSFKTNKWKRQCQVRIACRILHPRKLCEGLYLLHLGGRCSVHLCRLKASSIAFDGTFVANSRRRTNGCDQAQSEHLQFEDAVVGHRIFRVVSPMLELYAHFHSWSCAVDLNCTTQPAPPSGSNPFRVANGTHIHRKLPDVTPHPAIDVLLITPA